MDDLRDWLETAVQVSVFASFIGAVFSYFILKPLNASIKQLKESIDKLTAKFDKIDERQRVLEVRVAEIDQRSRSAHHRIDVIDRHLDLTREEDHYEL